MSSGTASLPVSTVLDSTSTTSSATTTESTCSTSTIATAVTVSTTTGSTPQTSASALMTSTTLDTVVPATSAKSTIRDDESDEPLDLSIRVPRKENEDKEVQTSPPAVQPSAVSTTIVSSTVATPIVSTTSATSPAQATAVATLIVSTTSSQSAAQATAVATPIVSTMSSAAGGSVTSPESPMVIGSSGSPANVSTGSPMDTLSAKGMTPPKDYTSEYYSLPKSSWRSGTPTHAPKADATAHSSQPVSQTPAANISASLATGGDAGATAAAQSATTPVGPKAQQFADLTTDQKLAQIQAEVDVMFGKKKKRRFRPYSSLPHTSFVTSEQGGVRSIA